MEATATATAIIGLSDLLLKYNARSNQGRIYRDQNVVVIKNRFQCFCAENGLVPQGLWWTDANSDSDVCSEMAFIREAMMHQSVADDDFSRISTAIQEFNISYPLAVMKPMTTDEFSLLFDKEHKGDILDLRQFHNMYEHTKAGLEAGPVSYIGYLNMFPAIDGVAHRDRSYKKYLKELLNYLVSFLKRAKPLLDLDVIFHRLRESFNESFEFSLLENMPDPELFKTVQDVEMLGSFNLTMALLACGQPSGGRNTEKVRRLLEALRGDHAASYTNRSFINKAKVIPLLEIYIKEACSHLDTVLKQTIRMHTV